MEVFKSTGYEPEAQIGHGSSGVVWAARHRKTEQKVAIKQIMSPFKTKESSRRTLREAKLMMHNSHENLMSAYDVIELENSGDILIVMEQMDTDLGRIIESKNDITTMHSQLFIYQILRGLKYLHSTNVIHRDIKPQNCLVNTNCDLKITDFGSAIEIGSEEKGIVSQDTDVTTLWYRSPEILMKTKKNSTAVDVWSVGCIFAEVVAGKPIFKGKDASEQLSLILDVAENCGKKNSDPDLCKMSQNSSDNSKPKTLRDLVPDLSPVAFDLLCRMLTFDCEKRISVDEALRHPYFEDMHDSEDEPVAENLFKFPKFNSSRSPLEEFRLMFSKDQPINQ